ncbi:hypothetical protein [Chryseobacterium caseinilyticum]|uniref:Uncharacterized protein n=1 Tax=Chryseobacterium caseinilyticum TaxID=2771428 RepID=A0ABR8ZH46_9FLAO|nr:hypothetical protein [Chryseobacterium caseinilyticum]MBD8084633.1 hypothetical protein [Chryseobacterium caseinilyticum]
MLLVIFSLFSSLTAAQVGLETPKPAQTQIFFEGSATLHSSDEIFNAQIESQKIKIGNDQKNLLSIKKVGSKIIIRNENNRENFSEQLKTAQKKKSDEIKKSVDKKIKASLAKVKSHSRDVIKSHSSEEFAHLGGSLKQNFVNPKPTNDFQKGISEKQYTILIRTFNYLHEKKILDYNSQSKKFGFTKVLSVRPPPAKS